MQHAAVYTQQQPAQRVVPCGGCPAWRILATEVIITYMLRTFRGYECRNSTLATPQCGA
jgi:hypothetical protein